MTTRRRHFGGAALGGSMLAGLLACRTAPPPSSDSPPDTPTRVPDAPISDPATPADPDAPRGFWAIWAEEGRVFTLHDHLAEPEAPRTLEIRVAEVQRVEGVTVAFLDWSYVVAGAREPADSVFGAVLLRGEQARILWGTDQPDLEDVEQWLHEPMPYSGIPQEGEQMVESLPDSQSPDAACLARDESVEDQMCDDTCYGYACFHATRGVFALDGLLAPEWGIFADSPLPPEP